MVFNLSWTNTKTNSEHSERADLVRIIQRDFSYLCSFIHLKLISKELLPLMSVIYEPAGVFRFCEKNNTVIF